MEGIGKYQIGKQPEYQADEDTSLWDGSKEFFPPAELVPMREEPLHEALGGGLPGMPGRQDPPIPGNPPTLPSQPATQPAATPAPAQTPIPVPAPVATPQPSRTSYAPQDTDQDGIVSQIERYMAYQQMTPDERKRDWIEQNVWQKGYTVDMVTGQILDPEQGTTLGRLPSFE